MVFAVLDTFAPTTALHSDSCVPLSECFTLILCSLYQQMHSAITQLNIFLMFILNKVFFTFLSLYFYFIFRNPSSRRTSSCKPVWYENNEILTHLALSQIDISSRCIVMKIKIGKNYHLTQPLPFYRSTHLSVNVKRFM